MRYQPHYARFAVDPQCCVLPVRYPRCAKLGSDVLNHFGALVSGRSRRAPVREERLRFVRRTIAAQKIPAHGELTLDVVMAEEYGLRRGI
jgi:hypothetical protein